MDWLIIYVIMNAIIESSVAALKRSLNHLDGREI